MKPFRLIVFLLLSELLSGAALSNPSIETKIISGGEVSIMDVNARYDGHTVAVSGTGFEIFPRRTCGFPEIKFLDANGRVLLRKDAFYRTDYWYISSARSTFDRSRWVSFSLNVPIPAAVASVLVSHQSTGGCEHDWSLQYGLDWFLDKTF